MENNNNAGYIIRSFAAITDFLLAAYPLTVILLASSSVYFFDVGTNTAFFIFCCVFLSLIFLLAPLTILYTTFFTSKFGGTIGKLIFGLKIVNKETGVLLDRKQAFYRLILGYAFSNEFFGLGYLKVIKSKDKLAWHDELFETKVTKSRDFVTGLVASILVILVGWVILVMTASYVISLINL